MQRKAYNISQALDHANTVEELHVHGLELEAIPEEVQQFTALRYFDFSLNWLSQMPPLDWWNSPIQQLDLSRNRLSTLELPLSICASLEWIDISDNQFSTFPSILLQCPNLKYLNISGNEIGHLPKGIAQCSQLQVLKVNHCGLKAVPESLSACQYLIEVECAHNRLRQIPEGAALWSALEVLDLSFNQVSFLPDQQGQWPSLRKLYLQNNRLETLPAALLEFSELVEIVASKNKIQHLPEGQGKWPYLRVCQLQHNRMVELPDDWFGRSPLLLSLDVSHNALHQWPKSITKIPVLENLLADKNPIETFPELPAYGHLRKLSLSKTKIHSIPEAIGKCIQLKELHLSGNPLVTVDAHIATLKKLEKIRTSDPLPTPSAWKKFIKVAERKRWSQAVRMGLWQVWQSSVPCYDKKVLYAGLSSTISTITDICLHQGQQHFGVALEDVPLKSSIWVSGRFSVPRKVIVHQLEALGFRVEKQAKEASYALLGKNPAALPMRNFELMLWISIDSFIV